MNKVEVVNEKNGDKVFKFSHGVDMRLKKCRGGSNTFWMGETEVTEAQWRCVMNEGWLGDDHPTNNYPKNQVTLEDCKRFMSRVRELTGVKVELPDTNSWVTACLAGGTNVYWWGESPLYGKNNGGNFQADGLNVVGNKDGKRRFLPNGWGLYDVHGNVAEWCVGEGYGKGFLCGGGYRNGPEACTARSILPVGLDNPKGNPQWGFRVFLRKGL